jgi:hypothetical protein
VEPLGPRALSIGAAIAVLATAALAFRLRAGED